MKKRLFSFVAIQAVAFLIGAFSFQTFAQSTTPCATGLHEAFGPASTKKPVLLRRLGTSPQFGEIPQHTSKSAYDHLKKVHSRNLKGSKREIDNFLKVLGYSGFNDPAFTTAKITPAVLAKGKTGWMGGYSRGHQYKWSILGNDFPTFKISSKDGSCHAYIMKKCGNAFYDPSEKVDCEPCTSCDPDRNDKTKCPECNTQELSFNGTGSIVAGDVINTTQVVPVVASYAGKTLCVGEQTVPVRLTYELSANGSVDYKRAFQVCDYGSNAPTSLNMPVLLAYQVTGSNVSLGENGSAQINMPLTKKQYKQMKKLYSACDVTTASIVPNTYSTERAKVLTTGSPAATISNSIKTNPLNCVKQTVTLTGKGEVLDFSEKVATQEVTIIGKYVKEGKLKKGETPEKYRCLGSYSIPANSQVFYNLTANSKIEHIIDVCDDGNVNPNLGLEVPMTLNANFTKQDIMVGDYGRVVVPLTKAQFKKIKKAYQSCCADGSSKCF